MKFYNKYQNQGVIVHTMPRSGSAYLCALFRMAQVRKTYPDNIISQIPPEKLFKKYNTNINFYNFLSTRNNYIGKFFEHQIKNPKMLFPYNAYKVLLIRKQMFDNIISLAYSHIVNIWWNDNPNKYFKQIDINILQFQKYIDICISNYKILFSNKYNIKYDLIINYEDFSLNTKKDFNILLPEYTAQRTTASIRFPEDKKLLIKNYNELKDYFLSVVNNYKIPNTETHNGVVQNYKVKI